jgi:hypothetical protein
MGNVQSVDHRINVSYSLNSGYVEHYYFTTILSVWITFQVTDQGI